MNWEQLIERTPCYVIDRGLLRKNLELLGSVQQRTSCKIILALKGFAAWSVFDLCKQYLAGAAASSLHEARLAREEFGGEVHLCAPAYRQDEIDELFTLCDHVVFNSFDQWRKFRDKAKAAGVECGLRVNPQHSEVTTPLYDPCRAGSRFGVTADQFEPDELDGISGLHFHTLCELNSDSLERTLAAFETKFGKYISKMKWINFGGGHHITRTDYDVDLLCRLINNFRQKYNVDVYLEPGEAIALNTGFLVSSVLDIINNEMDVAILDTSASAHMPDVLEMPYRPVITGAGQPNEKKYTYRLSAPTCLAGDVIGDYSFDEPLKPGDKLVFHDMAHYTMVKNNMFNGINLPDIVIYDPENNEAKVQRHFGYEDFKRRLS